MSEVYLKLVNGKWTESDINNCDKDTKGNPIRMNVLLREKLDVVLNLQRDKWDAMFIIDGRERSGKSSIAALCGWYLTNGKLTADNFASGITDAAEKIERLPEKSVLIFDEASTMFGSKDTASKGQKQLIKILDVVGQKNMIFILCLPCFFDLNKTLAVRRSLFLLHIKAKELETTWKREPFYYFDERRKGTLYRTGKKNYDSYSFPEPNFDGKYYEFVPPFWEEYEQQIKKASLKEVINAAKGRTPAAIKKEENMMYKIGKLAVWLSKDYQIKQQEMADKLGITQQTLGDYILYYQTKEGLGSAKTDRGGVVT